MKPKYKIGAWLDTGEGVAQVRGIIINKYGSDDEDRCSNVQYEFWGEDYFADEFDIICEMVPKK